MNTRENIDSGSWLRPLRWAEPSMAGPEGELSLPIGTVSFLLTDIEGSTRLWQDAPEAMQAAVARHYEILDSAVSAHGGVRPEEQGEGDSVVAAFPRASDAVRAALDAQLALAAEPWPTPRAIHVRMAVHTGEAKLRDEANYIGMAIIRTARLRAVAAGGQVLVSSAARDLVLDHLGDEISLVDLGEHRLKDLARPERVFQLTHPSLPAAFPALKSLDSVRNNLPVRLSPFIGRTAEVETVTTLLDHHRCVTMTGSGGAGKTRLALQTAAEVSDRFPQGVWWIELAPITATGRVGAAVADAMGVAYDDVADAAKGLVRRLSDETVLVVMDNAEHLVPEVAELVGRLLSSCPGVTVLTTSRVVLDVPGEVTWRIPPLSLPQRDHPVPVERLAQFDAVRLFVDRARRVRSTFRLGDANGPVIAELCHRLSGIPLAIELAAARTKMMAPVQILDGLADSLRILRGGSHLDAPRQQTLEASIAWSVALLADRERRLFERLSVFSGSFDLESAERVCADDDLGELDVLDALERLVDSSLVVPVENAEGRFMLLETLRQYGHRRLQIEGAVDAWRHRHGDRYADLAARVAPQCETASENWALSQLEPERANVLAALHWFAESGQPERLGEMACAMNAYWDVNGDKVESVGWFTKALDLLPPFDTSLRARLFAHRAEARFAMADFEGMMSDSSEAIRMGDAVGDRYATGRGRWTLATVTSYFDEHESARLAEQAVADLSSVGDLWARADVLQWQAYVLVTRGLISRARPLLDAAWAAALESESPLQISKCRLAQADLERQAGHPREALALARLVAAGGHMRSRNRRAGLALTTEACEFACGEPPSVSDLLAISNEARRDGDDAAADSYLLTWAYRHALTDPARVIEVCGTHVLVDRHPSLRAIIEAFFASAHLAMDDPTTARRHAESSAHWADQPATTESIAAWARCLLAATWLREGNPSAAEPVLREALDLVMSSGAMSYAPLVFELLADTHLRLGDAQTAGLLVSHSARLLTEMSMSRASFLLEWPTEPLRAEVREALGVDADTAARAAGEMMTTEEIVAVLDRGRGERRRPSVGWDSLTPTEEQVVALIREGLTNKQIATRLLMGAETVKTHVSHVFTKLGVSSRSQLAALAAERG